MERVREISSLLHRGLNALMIVAIVVQFYAAGWAAFGMPFTFHAVLGWILIAASVVLALFALVGHGFTRPGWSALLLIVLLILQPVFVFVLSAISIAITALHPVNGLLALYIVVDTERRLRAKNAPIPVGAGR